MRKYLTFPFLIRVGLGCMFLANSLTAFFVPAEFQNLVASSFLAGILPISGSMFVILVGINDFLVAMLLFSGWHTSRVAVWATVWLIGVIAVIGVFSINAVGQLGALVIAIALAMRTNNRY